MSGYPTAVLFSGGGRTLANLLRHQAAGDLPIDIRLTIASREGLGGIEIARRHHIECRVVKKASAADAPAYQSAIFDPIRQRGCRLVLMAGFLKHVLIPHDFERRVLNIHPSLLPAFGGAGMYGDRVHRAVIRRGVQVSGCTVHLVDNIYDNGSIVLQRWCEVEPGDTPETLAKRVFELECEAFPTAIARYLKERIEV